MRLDGSMWCLEAIRSTPLGLVWWSRVKRLPANARGHGFGPWSWKVPHATEHVSVSAKTTNSGL